MRDKLVEAWRTNHRINLKLIDSIDAKGMAATLSTRGGRDVIRQFAHLHNVRVWHLQRRAKHLATPLAVFATADRPTKTQLKKALAASTAVVEELLTGAGAGTKGIGGFKRGPIQTLAYFIAHDSHHRGNILLTLKQSGHRIDKATRYGIWDWDRL